MIDFFGQFIPAHPVARGRPDLPLDRLGSLLGEAEQLPRLSERVIAGAGRYQARAVGDQSGQLLQVAGDRPPPSPVSAKQLGEAVGVDGRLPTAALLSPPPRCAFPPPPFPPPPPPAPPPPPRGTRPPKGGVLGNPFL